MVKVFGGDPMEAAHPRFQAAVAGVDVLDVEDTLHHMNPLLHIDRAVDDSGLAGEGLTDVRAI